MQHFQGGKTKGFGEMSGGHPGGVSTLVLTVQSEILQSG